MRIPRPRYLVAAIAIILVLLAITLVPAVPYRLSISDPSFPYRMQGYMACENQYERNNTFNVGNPAFERCIAQYLIPPINITGYGSLSFSYLGIGLGPFPSTMSVGENDFYATLYMSGARIVAAEQVPQQDVVYNSPGITIDNSSISEGFLGNSNATVTVTNRSGQTLANPWVFASVPGSSGNYTDKSGVTWIFYDSADSILAGSPCMQDGKPQNLTNGASCTVILNTIVSVPFGSPFRYSVEVQGRLGQQYSITKETYSYSISAQALNQEWTSTFIGIVNGARNSSAMVESSTLDQFAKLRFSTAVGQPDISDYGLYADEASFFGANSTGTQLVEVLLYPAMPSESPSSYASQIQRSAPGHWSALTDKDFTHFGYFVGTGPYEVVQQPCPVFEIPNGGINITQYFESAGCSVSLQQSTWLVIILGR